MTIPSRRWFPTNLPARAVWFGNFDEQFSDVAASLGFTAADIEAVHNDNQVMQFLAETDSQSEAFKKAQIKFRQLITEGDIGKPTPAFPGNPNFVLPVIVETGIFERLVKLVERIKVAPNYTDEIGALLGILTPEDDSISPESVKSSIEVFAAAEDYMFSVVVSNRAKADSWDVEIRREGQEKWQTIKTATGKSIDVEVQPTAEGKPERIQVRVRLRKNNADYGQLSDMVAVTLNP